MNREIRLLWLIILISLAAFFVALPKVQLKFEKGSVKIDQEIGGYNLDFDFLGMKFKRVLEFKQGLDLQGGLQVTLQADMAKIKEADRSQALGSVKNVMERRVNLFGVAEPNIYTSKTSNDYRIIVELPGLKDTKDALALIGQTAQLEFREVDETANAQVPFKPTDLTGKDLTKALVSFNSTSGEPQVEISFNSSGANKFEEITKRNIGKPLAIYLDNILVSAPTVQTAISGGQAIISGQFTVEEANKLAIQLNAGALPVPVKVIRQSEVGPTLGAESVNKSVRAGLFGLLVLAFFMIVYYGRLGILATLALIIYSLITLAIYKFVPITLTLPGIAGFILSIGMALDSNILIFERLKEELRLGRPLKAAMELGFGRAWSSIRDANLATLITVFILFNPLNWSFLNVSGMVRGFALTLGLGIFVGLFTQIVVVRTLVRVFYK